MHERLATWRLYAFVFDAGAKGGGERRVPRRSRKSRQSKARDENQGEAKKEAKEQNKGTNDQGAELIKAMGALLSCLVEFAHEKSSMQAS